MNDMHQPRAHRRTLLAGSVFLALLLTPLMIAAAPQPPGAGEASSTGGAEAFDPSTLPDVVARVAGQEITRDQLVSEAENARTAMLQNGMPRQATETEEFYRQALDQVVAGILLYEEAKDEEMTATDEEIDEQITALEDRLGEDRSLSDVLASQGMSQEDFRAQVRKSLSVQKVIDAKITPQITISDEEIQGFYESNIDRMKRPPRARVRHILLKVGPEAGEEERQTVRQEAESLRQQIAEGADFATLAEEHSDDEQSREQGGLLPWISPGQTVPAFDEAAFDLEVGKLSEVIQSPFGFHVLKVEEREPASTVPLEEVRDRIAALLRDRRTREQLHEHVTALKQEHEVEILL